MSASPPTQRVAAGAIALAAGLAFPAIAQDKAAPAGAQPRDLAGEQVKRQAEQPLNNAPVWREVRSGGPQTTQVRGVETNVLVQSEGETWRQIRNGPITVYGGLVMLAVPLLILGFFLWKGPRKVHGALTGRKILRLSAWDRCIHWTTAISWCVLAISGLILLFWKYVLMPIIGGTLFSWLAQLAKILHNFIGPVFLLAAILMFVQYVGRNIPRGHDFGWLAKGGGLLTGQHVPSGFFNAGEKIVFWVGLTIFDVVVSLSGLVLNFTNFRPGAGHHAERAPDPLHHGHTVHGHDDGAHLHGHRGRRGGLQDDASRRPVDEQWAREHHEHWYNDVKSGKASHGAPAPAGVPQSSHA